MNSKQRILYCITTFLLTVLSLVNEYATTHHVIFILDGDITLTALFVIILCFSIILINILSLKKRYRSLMYIEFVITVIYIILLLCIPEYSALNLYTGVYLLFVIPYAIVIVLNFVKERNNIKSALTSDDADNIASGIVLSLIFISSSVIFFLIRLVFPDTTIYLLILYVIAFHFISPILYFYVLKNCIIKKSETS